MTEQEAVKQSANLLKSIIRSIDKKLEYNFLESAQEGRFSLRLTTRGKTGVVSVLTSDLRLALTDDVRKNAIRQKIKGVRDHMLSVYVEDVMGNKMARMLSADAAGQGDSKPSFFYRRPGGRR
ncbi:MAG TPA: hypothetical protein VGH22_00285 [Candidatus Binatia bacterium]|jgi:hypothetical protein